jgi:hypothetical protein
MIVSSVAMETWNVRYSNDGGNGTKNHVGPIIFDQDRTLKSTRPAAAGMVAERKRHLCLQRGKDVELVRGAEGGVGKACCKKPCSKVTAVVSKAADLASEAADRARDAVNLARVAVNLARDASITAREVANLAREEPSREVHEEEVRDKVCDILIRRIILYTDISATRMRINNFKIMTKSTNIKYQYD